MDLEARIRRRRRAEDESQLVLDYSAISPTAHLAEPTDRGPLFEELLDYADPVFEDALPPNAYVFGPAGTGKSAVVTALFQKLEQTVTRSQQVIHTSTRADVSPPVEFVYVDAREASSQFGLYHSVLDEVSGESIPEHGISTDHLRDQLHNHLRGSQSPVLVTVDHLGEPETYDLADVAAAFGPVDSWLSWVAVGESEPEELAPDVVPETTIEVPDYERHSLVDILTERTSMGLSRRAIEHDQLRRVAEWADGNAHDALAAVFGAVDAAAESNQDRVTDEDLEVGMDAVPWPSVSLGRVLALPDNRQTVLYHLVMLGQEKRRSVERAADEIAALEVVDLSVGTVKRFIYELAESGIVERVPIEKTDGSGRPPSRVEPRFPTRVFQRLYDLDNRE
jgi:Cdc6-like AAA superfamily ATPase